MSKNLDAVLRYRVINESLRNKFKKYPTKAQLIHAFEVKLDLYVSERTLDKDLNEMRYNEGLGYFAPIEFNKKEKGYFYTDPNYSIDKIPIGNSDLNAIEFAAEILGQFKNVSILNDFKGAVNKIIDTVKVQRILYNEPSLKGLIQLDNMDNIPGSEHLNHLIECIKSKYICQLTYKKFGSATVKMYGFEPYILKEYDGLWYVTGCITLHNELRTFALDRISEVLVTSDFFEIQKSFDRSIYYNNVFGVTHTNNQPVQVKVRVDLQNARFLEIKPIHKSQQLTERTDQYVYFEYHLVLNPEIETKFMSLGPACEVIAPKELRISIQEKFKKALQNYE